MSQKAKLLIILLVISTAIFIYLILSAKVETVKQTEIDSADRSESATNQADQAELEGIYKEKVKILVAEYEPIHAQAVKLISAPDRTSTSTVSIPDQISILKMRLLELTVPTEELKDLHWNLVLSISKLTAYLETNSADDLKESSRLIIDAKTKYPWLAE